MTENKNEKREFTTETDFHLPVGTVLSAEEAQSFIAAQQVSVKSAETERQRLEQNATDRAAYATWFAEQAGLIFQPVAQQSSAHMTGAEWAASFGYPSKSLTTGWRTLAHALMRMGLDPNGKTYLRLRNSNAYGQTPVRQCILNPKSTEADLLKVLADYADEDGKRIKQPGKPNAQTDSEKDEAAKQAKANAAMAQMLLQPLEGDNPHKIAMAAVGAIEQVARGLDADQWIEVNNRLDAIIKRENDHRSAEAAKVKKPARASRTRKAAEPKPEAKAS